MFTLIEVLAVMTIASIMLAISVGPLVRAIADEQLKSSARKVSRVVMLARQEAIVNRRRVAVIIPNNCDFLATCYVNKDTGAFDGWTQGKATVQLSTIGIVDGPYVIDEAGLVSPAHSTVPGIAWAMPNPPPTTCGAIVFKPSGSCYSIDGSAPYVVQILDAARSESGEVTVRSDKKFSLEVNCYTGRWRYLAEP
jgi:prepilin-type N-terminal cleavage/methylation domain-containing protein